MQISDNIYMDGTESSPNIVIESKEQLFSWLAEAAELEHNLLCCYLYAIFGLKKSKSEGVSDEELAAIERWKKIILGVALEEMTHLTLVSNILSSVGGTSHFLRPNFPVGPGLHPADIIIELAPFNLDTLQHFIFLERPEGVDVKDGVSFEELIINYRRQPREHSLMPHAGDYPTVGELYRAIRCSIEQLCGDKDEKLFFCGSPSLQVGPLEAPIKGLILVRDKESAFQALDTIVTQGEGATMKAGSHFERFCQIQTEYEELLKKNPNFTPSRPIARNPLMRSPAQAERKVWVNNPLAAKYMDVANSLYVLMLRLLVQTYSVDNRPAEDRRDLLNAAFNIMHSMVPMGERLTYLPANEKHPGINGGMSFAILRSLEPLAVTSEKKILTERMQEIIHALNDLLKNCEIEKLPSFYEDEIIKTREIVAKARGFLQNISLPKPQPKEKLAKDTNFAKSPTVATFDSPKNRPRNLGTPDVEYGDGKDIIVSFEAKKCIHARFCVTELPNVFKANTPGEWIFPDQTTKEQLMAVIQECPSGALQYKRKDGGREEPVPPVNTVRLRENGPYAFHGDLNICGDKSTLRATLCRCGYSNNKPYCDGSHLTSGYVSSGEMSTLSDTALPERGGELEIQAQANGPLHVTGNLEICTGTGRVIQRITEGYLCRCGLSENKPFCDNSHTAAGFIAAERESTL